MNIRTSISGDLELILSASEDGKVYIWQNMEEENGEMTKTYSKHKDRSDDFETFNPGVLLNNSSKTPRKSHHKAKSGKSS